MKRYTDIKEANRRLRQMDKALRDLTYATGAFLSGLDTVMQNPSMLERGKKIAELSNVLCMARDSVRYFALEVDYRHDPEIREGKRVLLVR